jgi:tetratricopeptide (TPR) repeat protein
MSLANLDQAEKKVRSQGGEDGVIAAIFETIGMTNRYFVEFGVEYATECNTAYLIEQGWNGLMMDGEGISHNPSAVVRQEYITAENINDLFPKYQVPAEFDLLSIDIDTNDYWVWQALTYKPRVVVIEYNASVPPDLRRTIVYDPKVKWSNTDYFGASLRALAELGATKGYELVYCERAGVNAFFVARAALPAGYQPRPLAEIYRPPNYSYQGLRHPPDGERIMLDPLADGLYERAVAAHQRKEHAQAEKLYRQLIETEPGHAGAHHRLGLLKLQSDDYQAAADLLRRAIELDPTVPDCHVHLGRAYKELGNVSEAIAAYRRALALDPNHISGLKYLAIALREQGELAEAAACLRLILRAFPCELDTHNNLGNILHRLGQRAEAIACFRQALRLNPEYASAHNNLGIALAIEGQADDALACFREALRINPKFINALNNLGLMLKKLGRIDEAEECYREVQRLNG